MIFFIRKSKMRKKLEELETLHRVSLETNRMITEAKNNEIAQYEKLYAASARTNKSIIKNRNIRIENLENEIAKLNTKMIVKDRNLDNCFDINKQMTNDLKEANLKIMKLEKNNTSLVKRNEALKKLYNKYKDLAIRVNNVNINVIRKLWCNKEAQRQLRRLADNEEINNIHTLRRYVKELAMLIGV